MPYLNMVLLQRRIGGYVMHFDFNHDQGWIWVKVEGCKWARLTEHEYDQIIAGDLAPLGMVAA